MNKEKTRLPLIRLIVQLTILFLIFIFAFNHYLGDSKISFLPALSTHSICPLGGLETLYTLATTGIYVSKIHSSSVILFFIALLVTILFGAIICGFICPFGTVQELVGKLGKKIIPKKFNKIIPKKIDNLLRYLKYIFLAKILIETALVGKLIFEKNDPYYALINFYSSEVLPSAIIILIIILIASFFIERPFCKYICPYGAVLSFFGQFSIFKIRRNKNTCINCKKCDSVCPMNIEVSDKENIAGNNCISCYKCVSDEACPKKDTLIISTKNIFKNEVTNSEN